jgi:hypothetical protein
MLDPPLLPLVIRLWRVFQANLLASLSWLLDRLVERSLASLGYHPEEG